MGEIYKSCWLVSSEKFSSLYQTFWWKIYFERKAKQIELGFTSNSYNPFRKKEKKTVSFADYNRIKKASETPTDELQDFLSADTIKDFNYLEEEKFCLNSSR